MNMRGELCSGNKTTYSSLLPYREQKQLGGMLVLSSLDWTNRVAAMRNINTIQLELYILDIVILI